METQLFCVSIIVCIELASVQPNSEMGPNPVKIQENFQNFLNSIRKSDKKKTEKYRNFLKQETVLEQRAFDEMKEELRFRRQKSVDKQTNLKYGSSNIGTFKRDLWHDNKRWGLMTWYPTEQPGCTWTPHFASFYQAHEDQRKDSRFNWVCEESFEKKLKICVSMFKTITSRKLESNYKIYKDEETVDRECKEYPVTFYEPMVNVTENYTYDQIETTIGAWMFKCPITKMRVKHPKGLGFPPKHIMKDFFITRGKLDERPIIAVLHNSTETNNICLRDIWYFDYSRITSNDTQTTPLLT